MPFEKSAGAVIFYKRGKKIEYLLLHYEAGHWDFPKGHIEKNENPIETAKREVEEETGIKDIEILPDFKDHISYFYRKPKRWIFGRPKDGDGIKARLEKHRNGAIFKTVTFYLTQAKTKEVKLSFEHIGYKWLPYKKALEQLTFNNAKETLKRANKFLKI